MSDQVGRLSLACMAGLTVVGDEQYSRVARWDCGFSPPTPVVISCEPQHGRGELLLKLTAKLALPKLFLRG
jgi:hypothetical protein